MGSQQKIEKDLNLIVKSSFYVFIGLAISKIFTYIYRIVIARNFGPEVYGVFSLAIMVVGIFAAFSSFGLAQGILRFVPQFRGRKQYGRIKSLARFSVGFVFISSVISGFILFFFSGFISNHIFHEESLTIFLKIFSLALPFWMVSSVFLSFIKSFEYVPTFSFISNIAATVSRVIFFSLLVFMGLSSWSITFSYFLGHVCVFIFSFFFFQRKIAPLLVFSKGKKVIDSREFFFYSAPLMFVGIVSMIFTWVDSFFIGVFLDAYEVGIYNAAVPLANLLIFAPEMFIQILFPVINREYSQKNYFAVRDLSKQVSKWIFMVNFFIIFILFSFPGSLLNLLFGGSFLSAENSLRILSIGFFFSGIFYVSSRIILVVGKSNVLFFDLLGTSILNVFLNISLIPKYGLVGASLATSISWVCLSFIWIIQSKRYMKFVPLKKSILRIFSVSFPVFALFYLIIPFFPETISTFLVLGIFFFLVYVLVLFLTKCFDKEDFYVFRGILKKAGLK